MKDVFEKYLLSLRQDRDDKTEHSDRGALETLLNAAAHAADPGVRIIHEAKKVAGSGAPDFKVMKAAMILGYVENKTVGENLDQVLKSGQIARYKALSNNILLTDYLQFIWIKDGKVNGREIIAFPDDLEGKPKKPREDRVKGFRTCCGASSPPRRKALAARNNWRSRLQSAAIFCAISSIANCGGRQMRTRRAVFGACIRFFAIRSFTNLRSVNSPMRLRKCWPTACFSRASIRFRRRLRCTMHGNMCRAPSGSSASWSTS
jgi:hypothetical protein